jgi:hypothetical protein
MNKNIVLLAMAMAMALLLLVNTSKATPIINDPSQWSSGTAGWVVNNTSYSMYENGAVLDTPRANVAELQFVGGGILPAGNLYATGEAFRGDYTSLFLRDNNVNQLLTVRFNFTAIDVPPNQMVGALALYFQAVNGDRWYYDLVPPSSLNVYQYAVNISDEQGWYRTQGTGSYMYDLSNVDQLGFELIGDNYLQTQRYQFSDLQLFMSIPEPESIVMIIMVLLSMLMTFREQVLKNLTHIKTKIIAIYS